MISRRNFLRSSSALIALPALESLGFRRFASAAQTVTARPKRAVFLNFGWGVTNETWFPDLTQTGPDYRQSACPSTYTSRAVRNCGMRQHGRAVVQNRALDHCGTRVSFRGRVKAH